MTTRTVNVDLDAWFANTLGGAGNGNGNKMSVGMGTSSWPWQQRFAISIPRPGLFTGIPSAAAISAFNIKLRTNSGNSGIGGSVKFYLERGTTAFTGFIVVAGANGVPAGANISAYVVSAGPSTGHWPGPTRDAANRGEYQGSPAADAWISVPMLALGQWWYAHPEITGLVLVGIASDGAGGYDESTTSRRCTFYTSESTSIPYAEITYGGNTPPNAPTNPVVTYGADGTSFTITTTYSDQDGDTSTAYEIVFSPD